MTAGEAVAVQIGGELAARWAWWAAWVGLDEHEAGSHALAARAELAATQLTGDDLALAAETCLDVLGALFAPGDPPDEWWRTPLGRACARTYGYADESVTQATAARLLGVGRARVGQLLGAGKLDRTPDGGVLRGSVMRRIAADG